jgi:hypothetical protein
MRFPIRRREFTPSRRYLAGEVITGRPCADATGALRDLDERTVRYEPASI